MLIKDFEKAYKDLVDVLIVRRGALNLTQQQAADRCQIAQPCVSGIESGKRPMAVSTLIRYADALNLDVVLVPKEKSPPKRQQNRVVGTRIKEE